MKRRLISVVVLFVCACGGAQSPGGSTGEGAGADSGKKKQSAADLLGVTPPDKPWGEMSLEEREWYMIGKVMPIMEEQFHDSDPNKYAEFTCETCHGPDGKKQKWAMPSAALPPVYESGTDGHKKMMAEHRDVVTFMAQSVTPTMQTLLGLDAYDPKSEEGFGCYGCHVKGN